MNWTETRHLLTELGIEDLPEEWQWRIALTGANLEGAYLRDAYLTGANLEGAYLTGAYLEGAYLRDAYLGDAYLGGAYLRGAYLGGAYLRGAYLRDANLGGAYLRGAYLTDANLGGAYLPTVVKIENLDNKILALIESGEGNLEMSAWHTCQTTHCRAGWAINLAGEAGRVLEDIYGPSVAGAIIYASSYPDLPVPDFIVSNEDALADIRSRARRD